VTLAGAASSRTVPWKSIVRATIGLGVAALLGVWVGTELDSTDPDARPATRQIAPTIVFLRPNAPEDAVDAERERVVGRSPTWESLGLTPEEIPEVDEPRVFVRGDEAAEPVRETRGAETTEDVDGTGDGGAPDGGAGAETEEEDADESEALETEEQALASVEEPTGEPCGTVTCAPGKQCCNASCGICTDPGQPCHQRTCGMSYIPLSVGCGPATCNVGQLCCNPSCGICVAPGEGCRTEPCWNPITDLVSESCGMSTCNVGEVCCNPSCGICTKPGEPCSREVCD
jgi:hypothetical protein